MSRDTVASMSALHEFRDRWSQAVPVAVPMARVTKRVRSWWTIEGLADYARGSIQMLVVIQAFSLTILAQNWGGTVGWTGEVIAALAVGALHTAAVFAAVRSGLPLAGLGKPGVATADAEDGLVLPGGQGRSAEHPSRTLRSAHGPDSGWTARRWALLALGVATGAMFVAAFALAPGVVQLANGGTVAPRLSLVTIAAAFGLGALAVSNPIRKLVPGFAAAVMLVAAVMITTEIFTVGLFLLLAAQVVGMPLVFRSEGYFVRLVRDRDRARANEARLAVAEERLRFSRDLHDALGQALSAMAVKSEVAAALAQAGDPRAVDEMMAVRSLAHEAHREVRKVVAGHRDADLATELEGAQSLLRSAGIRARVSGDPDAVPPLLASVFAWVVREAVTNVVRHSRARTCTITVTTSDAGVGLTIVNDGATASPSGINQPSGTGLTGLRERLAAVGGTLATEVDTETFTLDAHVAGATATASPPAPAGLQSDGAPLTIDHDPAEARA